MCVAWVGPRGSQTREQEGEGKTSTQGEHTRNGLTHIHDYPDPFMRMDYCSLVEDKVLSTISSSVIWVLWKVRCKCVFRKVKQNTIELVKEIWLMFCIL